MKRCGRKIVWFLMGLLLSGVACQRTTDSVTPPPPTADAPSAVPDPKQRAMAAKDALFQELSTKLMAAMAQGGPAPAIKVCSEEAPKIAERVSKEQGVTIGRTSFQLRNTNNTPPEWAAEWIADREATPQFKELPNGNTAALLPILLKAQCLACHGPTEQLAPEVLQTLNELYPNDQATGFHEGDLRGWFWVEVPK